MMFEDTSAVLGLAVGPYFCGYVWGWTNRFYVKQVIMIVYGLCLGTCVLDTFFGADLTGKLGMTVTACLWYGVGRVSARKCKRYLRVMGWQGYVFKVSAAVFSVGVGGALWSTVALCIPRLSGYFGGLEDVAALMTHLLVALVALALLEPYYSKYPDVVKRVVRRRMGVLVLLWTAVAFALDRGWGEVVLRLLWWARETEVPFAFKVFCCYPLGLLCGLPQFESVQESTPSDEGSRTIALNGELGSVGGMLAAMAGHHGTGAVYGRHGFALKGTVHFDVPLPAGWRAGKVRHTAHRVWQNFTPPKNWPAMVSLSVYAFAPNRVREELGNRAGEFRDHPIFANNRRHDLLLHTAEVWLRARGASIREKHCGTIHGVPSVECVFTRSPARVFWLSALVKTHGYVAAFIIENYEVVFVFESDVKTFERFLGDAKIMFREVILRIDD